MSLELYAYRGEVQILIRQNQLSAIGSRDKILTTTTKKDTYNVSG